MKIIETNSHTYVRHWGRWYIGYGSYLARVKRKP